MKLLVLLVCLTAGCASIREGNLQPIHDWPPKGSQREQTISLNITGEATVNGNPVSVDPNSLEIWKKQIAKAYLDSNLFHEVTVGQADTDLQAEVTVRDINTGDKAMALVCCLTLTILPTTNEDRFVIETIIKNKEGQILGSFLKDETVIFHVSFFMIFAAPFNWPATVIKDTLYDLNRATIMEARKRNII